MEEELPMVGKQPSLYAKQQQRWLLVGRKLHAACRAAHLLGNL